MKTKPIFIILPCLLILSACTLPTGPITTLPPTPTLVLQDTSTPTLVPTAPFTPTNTATSTFTPTITFTPTLTFTPTETFTPTLTATPTYSFPTVVVSMQAHCRYGPSKAYLHAADLYEGDTGQVWGRFPYSNWLYVQMDKLNYQCWLAPSVVTVTGDTSTLAYQQVRLPGPSVLYDAPTGVRATRRKNEVTITWDKLWMTKDDDRGYFIEAWVCQDGAYLWWTASMADNTITSYTVKDEAGCAQPSSGMLYAVEKHGYTKPIKIPWPLP